MGVPKGKAAYRQNIADKLSELDEGEREGWLLDQLAQRTAELAGTDRKVSDLEAQLAEAGGSAGVKPAGAANAGDETVAQARELLDELKGRRTLIELREHALERAEAENIPYSLALKLAQNDIETTDGNLDLLIGMADNVFDSAMDKKNWREFSTLGDPNTRAGAGTVRIPAGEAARLKSAGTKGRGFNVAALSMEEYNRIPDSVRKNMGSYLDAQMRGSKDE